MSLCGPSANSAKDSSPPSHSSRRRLNVKFIDFDLEIFGQRTQFRQGIDQCLALGFPSRATVAPVGDLHATAAIDHHGSASPTAFVCRFW